MRKFFISIFIFTVILFSTATFANDFKIKVYASNRTMDAPLMFGVFGRVRTEVPPQSSRQVYNDAIFSGSVLLIDMRFKDLEQSIMIGREWIEDNKCEYLDAIWKTNIEPPYFEVYCKQPNGGLIQVSGPVTVKKVISTGEK